MSSPHSNSHSSTDGFAPSPRREADLQRKRKRIGDNGRFDEVFERDSVESDRRILSSKHNSPFRSSMRDTGTSSGFKFQPESHTPGGAGRGPISFGSGTLARSFHIPTVHDPSHVVHQPSTLSVMASAKAGVSMVRVFARLIMLVVISIPIGYVIMYIKQTLRSEEPLRQLKAFARQEAANNRVENIDELPVDGLKLYAQATCVKGPTVNHVRKALHLQLQNIPDQARVDIINAAVVEGMDTVSTRQDTAADVADSGKAFSYLAYWNTKFNGDQAVVPSERYSTCIMAAGVDVKIGEQVAGYEHSSRNIVVGTKPCKCGLFWCVGRCPEYEKITTKRPVFKRHQLTLKNQQDLHRWMVKQAIAQTQSLVYSSRRLAGSSNEENPSILWKAPEEDYFIGNDDGAGPSDHQYDSDPKQDL